MKQKSTSDSNDTDHAQEKQSIFSVWHVFFELQETLSYTYTFEYS